MESKKTYYLYALRHPVTNELRYIGQTGRSPQSRLTQHIKYSATKWGRTPTNAWIRKLLAQGLEPKQQILTSVSTRADIDRLEIAAIRGLRKRGFRLLNRSSGGRRNGDFEMTPERKAKLTAQLHNYRETHGHPHLGRKQKPATLERKSVSMKRRWKDPKYRENVIGALTGKKKNLTKEQIERNSKVSTEWWTINPDKGAELKVKLAERNKRNWADPVFREKMRVANEAYAQRRREEKARRKEATLDGERETAVD